MLELAVASDRAAVNALARQVHALHVDWRPDLFCMTDELFPEERFLSLIQERQIYVAKLDGLVVGYAVLKIREVDRPSMVWRKILLLDEICVEEALRGHGIGTQMMTDIHALARAFGCTDMQLGVYPQNDAAVAFYQKCGFSIRSIDMQRKI